MSYQNGPEIKRDFFFIVLLKLFDKVQQTVDGSSSKGKALHRFSVGYWLAVLHVYCRVETLLWMLHCKTMIQFLNLRFYQRHRSFKAAIVFSVSASSCSVLLCSLQV